jgi:hypothetical protein
MPSGRSAFRRESAETISVITPGVLDLISSSTMVWLSNYRQLSPFIPLQKFKKEVLFMFICLD